MKAISDATLAKLLAERLSRSGAVQIFIRDFGDPHGGFDTVYVSSFAYVSGDVVRVTATSSGDLEGALRTFFRNLDMATTPRSGEKETEHDDER